MDDLDEWEPSVEDFQKTFKRVRDGRCSLISGVRVEELLVADKDFLALYYIVATWGDIAWYRFQNMMGDNSLGLETPEYWRQLDMNRVVHTYWSIIKDLRDESCGIHCGDCVAVACSCHRCRAEYDYFETKHILEIFGVPIFTLIAMLLSRDYQRITNSDNFTREFRAKKIDPADSSKWTEVYIEIRAKYPREDIINLETYSKHWAGLSDEEREIYLKRVKQIREWCDNIPECPGVPWW